MNLYREKPIDLIHLHDRAPFIGAAWASRRLSVPVTYTAHSCFHSGTERLPHVFAHVICRLLERRIARSGVPIIAVSRWTCDSMLAIGADPQRISIVHNAVNVTEFPYTGMTGRNAGEVVFVGRLDHEKGFDVLLQAIQRTTSEHNVRLIAVGTGALEERYRELADELGVADRVTFAGRQFGSDLVSAYHRAAVCILPSRSEPFGMVMLEAMACGVPFIGTAVGGIAEVCEHGETGLLVPPEDPAALAKAISRLLDDLELASRLAENARLMVEQRFSWLNVAEQTRQFYDHVLANYRLSARLVSQRRSAIR